MIYNFCTLFDKNFIYRGLALYQSLLATKINFELWILCMDDIVYEQLKKMNLQSVELIKLAVFEDGDSELLKIKATRSLTEYCWTISSSLPLYIFKYNPSLNNLAYLDSDLYFFSTPEPIYEEMGENSISIVRHNYSKELGYLEARSGIYNVRMIIFKNDELAKKCLKWWRERCLEWCFSYYEGGKLGDQMYLNDWPERFVGVHVVKNKGVNLAPWNLNKYLITKKGDDIFVDEDKLIYYHYHSFKMYCDGNFQLFYSSYLISGNDKNIIYSPYILKIKELVAKMKLESNGNVFGFNQKMGLYLRIKSFLKSKLSILFYFKSLYKS